MTRNRELSRQTQTTTELKYEVTVKFIEFNPYPIPTSTPTNQQNLLCPLVVTSLQFMSNDEAPFDHQWGRIYFYNATSGSKYKTTS